MRGICCGGSNRMGCDILPANPAALPAALPLPYWPAAGTGTLGACLRTGEPLLGLLGTAAGLLPLLGWLGGVGWLVGRGGWVVGLVGRELVGLAWGEDVRACEVQ